MGALKIEQILHLANCLLAINQPKQALEIMLSIEPNIELTSKMVDVYLQLEESEKATEFLNNILISYPGNIIAILNLIKIQLHYDNITQAKYIFNKIPIKLLQNKDIIKYELNKIVESLSNL